MQKTPFVSSNDDISLKCALFIVLHHGSLASTLLLPIITAGRTTAVALTHCLET